MHLQFVDSESTFAYFHAARAYLQAWGKPVAFYSDKHGVCRVNHPGDGMTQFGRALLALNIDIICANSSPAKGRVERANKTLQERVLKELRLLSAATLAEGNALLPAFIADYDVCFPKAPATHRTLRAGDDLDDAFAWKALDGARARASCADVSRRRSNSCRARSSPSLISRTVTPNTPWKSPGQCHLYLADG